MVLFDEEISVDQEEETSSSSALSYEDIYDAVYNAYVDAYNDCKEEEENAEALEEETSSEETYRVIVDNFPQSQNVRVNNFDESGIASITDAVNVEDTSDVISFGTETDARFYTIGESVAPSSAAQQTLLYTLDTRNLLLIFLLAWFVTYLVRMLLKTGFKFMKGRKNNE